MAVRQGGVYRREKGGKQTQVVTPTRDQRLGAHARHPSQQPVEKPATRSTKAAVEKSTPVKDADNADSTTDA
ncbi:hypothetical protein [Chromohalobacter israelensis]|uniref:hypothetical protein n=1 Tax=Chromohalobacter israelensis TaxID=141390 RepID=UPI001025C0C1|nr:hypothetical protein [Chromohalobacter salexigens]RXE48703.1 hypothetical protein B4O83_12285 [Chromohalobacter salexigens]